MHAVSPNAACNQLHRLTDNAYGEEKQEWNEL